MAQQVFTSTTPGEINFNDTEAGDYRDMNSIQRMLHRRLGHELYWGLLWKPGEGASSDSADVPNVRTVGEALEVQASGGMIVAVNPGWFIHRITDAGQPEPYILSYQLTAAQSITVDAADGTNPRWDVISVKLEHGPTTGSNETRKTRANPTVAPTSQSIAKRRNGRITITYTPGTPAGSPAEPSVPAGEVKIARIEVAAGAGSITSANIVDFRAPASARSWAVHAGGGFGGTGWTLSEDGVWTTNNTGNLRLPIVPPGLGVHDGNYPKALRLQALDVTYQLQAGATVDLQVRDIDATGALSWSTALDISSSFTRDNTKRNVFLDIHGAPFLTTPVWSNGHRSPTHSVTGHPLLCLRVSGHASGNTIYGVHVNWWGF